MLVTSSTGVNGLITKSYVRIPLHHDNSQLVHVEGQVHYFEQHSQAGVLQAVIVTYYRCSFLLEFLTLI